MSGFVTRWPVLVKETVTRADLDVADLDGADGDDAEIADSAGRGEISAAAVGRWRVRARTAYLDRCRLLQRLRQESLLDWVFADGPVPSGPGLGHPDAVAASARATEIERCSLTIAVRIRAVDSGGGAVLDLGVRVALVDPRTGVSHVLGSEIRDELIAIEHAAGHLN